MQTFIMVAQLMLSLSLLVFVHELGHFLAAKYFKTRVEKFYLFFDFLFPFPHILNFSLFKKKVGETTYGIGWFPLGGYVSIAGMVDETQSADQMASEPQPWEYRSKKWWQKLIILLAGVTFNMILACLIYSGILFFHNKEYLPASELQNGGVLASESAKKLGFQDGDVILRVNGKTPVRFEDLTPISVLFGGVYNVQRIENGKQVEKTILVPSSNYKEFKGGFFSPYYHSVTVENVIANTNAQKGGMKLGDKIISLNQKNIQSFDQLKHILDSNRSKIVDLVVSRDSQNIALKVLVGEDAKLGFQPGIAFLDTKYHMHPYSLGEALYYGTNECFKIFTLNVVSIGKMFSGEISAKENLGGPIAMAKAFGVEWDWLRFWMITAMISIGLAFMNLLPIPALDGGQALLVILEKITGKEVPPKVVQVIQNIGMIMILALMVFAFYNDLTRK